MISSDLYELEKYIFYQTEPVEIELYFEEILLSVNHNSFNVGDNITKFMAKYYNETERITEALLEGLEGKEFFKIQAMTNKDYIKNLLLSYFDLVKKVEEVQMKLLSRMRKEYIPITITINSYIINRIATQYTSQFYKNKVEVSKAAPKSPVLEAQIRDLHIEMICVEPTEGNLDFNELRMNFDLVKNVKKLKSIEEFILLKNKVYAVDTLKISELYSEVLSQDYATELDKWSKGGVAFISLPYFNLPERKISSDWMFNRLKFSKKNSI